ncbi:factor of DNA methylation 2-like [Impatiens glandulifera]|uniref:factor of DNA methylation 2-like n=1 Tax=Impatiens glandulifera TaxID=253017 RepID=UPI001FB0D7C4|nr:factor of DNA methylation 2-like [Impatiens glandulifera]
MDIRFSSKMGTSHFVEEEMQRLRHLVKHMGDEIAFMNRRLSESHLKYEDMCFTLRKLVVDLTMEIDHKNQRLADMELKLIEASNAAVRFKDETNAFREEHIQEMGKTDFLMVQNAKLKRELESRLRDLERHAKFLVESRAKDEDCKRCKDKEKLVISNAADQDVDALMKRLNDLEDVEALNRALIYKERLSNDELQDARKEAMIGLHNLLNSRTTIQIKRMGEIDQKPFQAFWKRKYPINHTNGEWEQMSAALCSLWEENVKNPHWLPFKKVQLHGKEEEVIDEDEEKLKELRKECGQEVYEAVTKALLELNDYNPSGRFTIQELWNVKEGRKATMKEIVQYVIKQMKNHKSKKRLR